MKILYMSGTYCPATGGAEISIHTFLREAKRNGNGVMVLTDEDRLNNLGIREYEGIPLKGTYHRDRKKNLEKTINEFKPTLIISQLMWSDVCLETALDHGVPSVLRVCKVPFCLDISTKSEFSPTSIMVVSDFVKTYVKDNWNMDSYVIRPPIDPSFVYNPNTPKSREYITMFNPNAKKGGKIFYELARKNPNRQFAIVKGWDILKQGGIISSESLYRMRESLRIPDSKHPIECINFDDLENVTLLPPSRNVFTIYDKTKILCVPSQWEETFGRVVIEGMMNRIPVIGSMVGGMKEQVQNGGLPITDFSNIGSWNDAITSLDDESTYQYFADKGRRYVDQCYDLPSIFHNFMSMLGETVK